jgi:hypothetical protein
MVFICFKNGIYWFAMDDMIIEICSGNVIKTAHISGVRRWIIDIVLSMQLT